MLLPRATEELGETPVPVPLRPPQILLDWPGREHGQPGLIFI